MGTNQAGKVYTGYMSKGETWFTYITNGYGTYNTISWDTINGQQISGSISVYTGTPTN